MTTLDRLYSKEQIEEWASKRADDAGRLSRQLLDTMRENERYVRAFNLIIKKAPYHSSEWQTILEIAAEAFGDKSNKDSSHE